MSAAGGLLTQLTDVVACDVDGCSVCLPVGRDATQYTAAIAARAARWLVLNGATRDYHFCPMHLSVVAIVLRFAAVEVRGEARGVHAALRELGIGEVEETARAVWATFHAVESVDPSARWWSHRDRLIAAARRADVLAGGGGR